jgi:hypothetical protein
MPNFPELGLSASWSSKAQLRRVRALTSQQVSNFIDRKGGSWRYRRVESLVAQFGAALKIKELNLRRPNLQPPRLSCPFAGRRPSMTLQGACGAPRILTSFPPRFLQPCLARPGGPEPFAALRNDSIDGSLHPLRREFRGRQSAERLWLLAGMWPGSGKVCAWPQRLARILPH